MTQAALEPVPALDSKPRGANQTPLEPRTKDNSERSGWSSIGCELQNHSKSPSQRWWDRTPGKPLDKLRAQDSDLAELVATKRLTLHSAKFALRLHDMDEFNTRALSLLGGYKNSGYQVVWHSCKSQSFLLKCKCGEMRASVVYFWRDSEQAYFVSCSQCGRGYSIAGGRCGAIREVAGLGESKPSWPDPSFKVSTETLCHFKDNFLKAKLAGQRNLRRAIRGEVAA